MADGIEVVGADRLASTLAQAARDLDTQADTIGADIARIIAPEAAARAPRRTGALAATVAAHGPTVSAGSPLVDYAAPVIGGVPSRNIPARPFLFQAEDSTQPRWTTAIVDRISRILARIKGA